MSRAPSPTTSEIFKHLISIISVKFRDPSQSPHRCHSRAQRRISVRTCSRMTKCSSCADIGQSGTPVPTTSEIFKRLIYVILENKNNGPNFKIRTVVYIFFFTSTESFPREKGCFPLILSVFRRRYGLSFPCRPKARSYSRMLLRE